MPVYIGKYSLGKKVNYMQKKPYECVGFLGRYIYIYMGDVRINFRKEDMYLHLLLD